MTDLDARQWPAEVASPVAQTQALVQIGSELAYMNDMLGLLVEAVQAQKSNTI